MKYVLAANTQTGLKREINQDSLLIKSIICKGQQMLLAVICDGMGGLQKGEVASASLVCAFAKWFEQEFPLIWGLEKNKVLLLKSWDEMIRKMSSKISDYGKKNRICLGTTLTAMLFTAEEYYIVHVGDSRVYRLKENTVQLTKDQTLMQWKLDEGILTKEEAEQRLEGSVLLQCVGSSEEIKPVYIKGKIDKDTVYLLCSDGFYHMTDRREMYKYFGPECMKNEEAMEKNLLNFLRMLKARGETDDISVITIRTRQEK